MTRCLLSAILAALSFVQFSYALDSIVGEKTDRDPFFATDLAEYVRARQSEFGDIEQNRKHALSALANRINTDLQDNERSRLVFICTHNSRRSQMCQVWANAAATHYKVPGIETYSGGTEETAFNPRAVKALREAGFEINEPGLTFKVGGSSRDSSNPRYQVCFRKDAEPLVCFSKVYDREPNPKEKFIAVMTCSEAEKSCPRVSGSTAIVSLPYNDPKVADGTPKEVALYAERSAQIAREMLYVFSVVAQQL